MDINKIEQLLIKDVISEKEDINFIFKNLKKLKKNRIEVVLLQKIANEEIENNSLANLYLREFADCQKKFLKSLKLLKTNLKNIPYLIIRSGQDISYTTYDLDILIKKEHFWIAQEIFKEKGYKIGSHNTSLSGRIPNSQYNILGNDILPIDVHTDFTWLRSCYFDTFDIFKLQQVIEIFGQEVKTWAIEYEILARLACLIFEKFGLDYLDYFSLKKLMKNSRIDFDFIEDQTKKYYWHEEYLMLMKKMKKIEENKISLPKFFSINEISKIFLNKIRYGRNFPLTPFLYLVYRRIRARS